jgi:sugar phosphate isomerase/epimerase
MAMPIPIALQLYSLREDCASDFLGTIRAVGKMGYEGVEFAGLHGHATSAVKAVLEEAALPAPSCHAPWPTLQKDTWEATAAQYRELGCHWLIVPGLPPENRADLDAVKRTADHMAWLADQLRPLGMRTGYHCHEGDMRPLPEGTLIWDTIASLTPADFIMQFDTSNAMDAGADAVAPLLKWAGRGQSVHAKEHRGPLVIGEGAVPWDAVFDACEGAAGTEWLVVEHEIYGDKTPLESVRDCLAGLKNLMGRRSG